MSQWCHEFSRLGSPARDFAAGWSDHETDEGFCRISKRILHIGRPKEGTGVYLCICETFSQVTEGNCGLNRSQTKIRCL